MNVHHRFDGVARSERYYADTLLPHLLMANNWNGLRLLFTNVFGADECTNLPDDFELVSELDPLRDGSVENPDIHSLYASQGRVAVPDLFLRWGHLCLVIEAKFFTLPHVDQLVKQIQEQERAINDVLQYTHYEAMKIAYLLLTVHPVIVPPETKILTLTWTALLDVVTAHASLTDDLAYCAATIQNGIERASRELRVDPAQRTWKIFNLKHIVRNHAQLSERGYAFVGFDGGISALRRAHKQELVERSGYKLSGNKYSKNWMTLEEFITIVTQKLMAE